MTQAHYEGLNLGIWGKQIVKKDTYLKKPMSSKGAIMLERRKSHIMKVPWLKSMPKQVNGKLER